MAQMFGDIVHNDLKLIVLLFNSFIGYVYMDRHIRQKGQCERDMESHAGHYP